MRQQGGKSQPEYLPGTTVFAKLKGYPWWPARIESDKKVPAKVLKQKSKAKGALYTVFFFGSKDYGFFGPDAIRPFNHEIVESDLKAKKFKTKDLELAVRQALNPSLLKEAEEEEEEEEEEDGEEEEEEEVPKPRKRPEPKKRANVPNGRGKKAVTEEKTTTASKRRSRKVAIGEDEDEIKEDVTQDSKRRRKSMSAEKEESPVAQTNESKEEIKKTPEYKKVYHIRHKLQRLVYNKKEGEIPKDDYSKILQVIKEIEEAPMTYNLLRDTKIGKVVKAACVYPFEDDSIKERCQQLMKSWKTTFLDATSSQSPLTSSAAIKEKDDDAVMQDG